MLLLPPITTSEAANILRAVARHGGGVRRSSGIPKVDVFTGAWYLPLPDVTTIETVLSMQGDETLMFLPELHFYTAKLDGFECGDCEPFAAVIDVDWVANSQSSSDAAELGVKHK